MTPEQIAEKAFPMNTSCPMKKKKIIYQREQLANDIRVYWSNYNRIQGQYIETK